MLTTAPGELTVKIQLKSDHAGIEISIGARRDAGTLKKLKSDHAGIEIWYIW